MIFLLLSRKYALYTRSLGERGIKNKERRCFWRGGDGLLEIIIDKGGKYLRRCERDMEALIKARDEEEFLIESSWLFSGKRNAKRVYFWFIEGSVCRCWNFRNIAHVGEGF